jgi:hypothetical protein
MVLIRNLLGFGRVSAHPNARIQAALGPLVVALLGEWSPTYAVR